MTVQKMPPSKKKSSRRERRQKKQLVFDDGLTIPKFISKLHELLVDESTQHIAHFLPDGRSFCVVDQCQFMAEVAHQYFSVSRYKSFNRQLNLYGFTLVEPDKIQALSASGEYPASSTARAVRFSCYQHPCFVRDNYQLSRYIYRMGSNKEADLADRIKSPSTMTPELRWSISQGVVPGHRRGASHIPHSILNIAGTPQKQGQSCKGIEMVSPSAALISPSLEGKNLAEPPFTPMRLTPKPVMSSSRQISASQTLESSFEKYLQHQSLLDASPHLLFSAPTPTTRNGTNSNGIMMAPTSTFGGHRLPAEHHEGESAPHVVNTTYREDEASIVVPTYSSSQMAMLERFLGHSGDEGLQPRPLQNCSTGPTSSFASSFFDACEFFNNKEASYDEELSEPCRNFVGDTAVMPIPQVSPWSLDDKDEDLEPVPISTFMVG